MKSKIITANLATTILIVFLINLASAVELSNTNINNTVSNVSIIISTSIYFDTLIIADDGSIYFNKLRSSDLTSESFTFNITNEANITIYGSPIWFSSSSSTSKHIASNLTDTVNVDVYIETDCSDTWQVIYRSDLGVNYTYNRNYIVNNCNNGVLYLGSVDVDPSVTSNIIEILLNQFNYFKTSVNFLLTILPIIGIIGVYLVFRRTIDGKMKAQVGIGLIIGIIISLWVFGIILNSIINIV